MKRKPADLHREVDRAEAGTARVTLANLSDRYLATIQNQIGKILKRKSHLAARMEANLSGGADVPAGKIIRSQVSA